MKKIIRITLIVLLILLVLIQFIRPKKNISNNITNEISTKYFIPPNVDTTLKIACYDCHSNNSRYPWYWNFQPVAWFLNGHIRDGKRHLNFSTFTSFNIYRQYRLFKEISNEVKSGDMPLASYTFIHVDARLSGQQKNEIIDWAALTRKQIEEHYPSDSLTQKRK